jgi:chromosome segregation ATPase
VRRKTISELEDELAMERDDNARLYTKVENLRAEIADLEDDCDDSESVVDADDEDSDSEDSASQEAI